MLKIIKAVAYTAFYLLYPYLIYLGLQQGASWPAPIVLGSLYAYSGWHAQSIGARRRNWGIALFCLAGILWAPSIAAKLTPLIVHVSSAYFFARTLWQGPSLIERFVRMEFSEFPVGVIEYCRQLTWMWTVFFVFNAMVCITLALWGSNQAWALYNGVVVLVMTGILMVGEYIWRHWHFPELRIPSPLTSMKTMIVNGRQIWLDVTAH